jgi:hypothetical protein
MGSAHDSQACDPDNHAASERADDFSFALLKGSAASGKTNLFDAIVALNPFERFVYVMSVLERQSDNDCSALLRCSRRDVIIARELALERLAKHTQSLRSTFGGSGNLANNVRESSRLTCKSSSAKTSGSQSGELRSPEELHQSDR